VWKRDHSSVDLAHQVDVHYPLEFLGLCPIEGSVEPNATQVHPGVEGPVLLRRPIRDRLYLLELGHVGRHGQGFATGASNLVD
jgi:hypothetical protein